jgi:hypothetical protein
MKSDVASDLGEKLQKVTFNFQVSVFVCPSLAPTVTDRRYRYQLPVARYGFSSIP